MVNFLALYRGHSLSDAQLVAVTSDPRIVAELAQRLLSQSEDKQQDPVLHQLQSCRRQALTLVQKEANDTTRGRYEETPDGT